MHEVALAERALQIALATAEKNGGGRITKVRVLIGKASCVEPDTFRFAMEIAARHTLAQGCEIDIEHVPLRLRCRQCGSEHEGELLAPCPVCQAIGLELLQGRELQIKSIDVQEEITSAAGQSSSKFADKRTKPPDPL